MDWDTIRGSWQQYVGKVRSKWGKLTDDDMERIGGKKDELVGRIRERYGMAKDKAEREVDGWLRSMGKDRQPRA
jgi:uncharacterized protein YjbJ (UPF0337 family)